MYEFDVRIQIKFLPLPPLVLVVMVVLLRVHRWYTCVIFTAWLCDTLTKRKPAIYFMPDGNSKRVASSPTKNNTLMMMCRPIQVYNTPKSTTKIYEIKNSIHAICCCFCWRWSWLCCSCCCFWRFILNILRFLTFLALFSRWNTRTSTHTHTSASGLITRTDVDSLPHPRSALNHKRMHAHMCRGRVSGMWPNGLTFVQKEVVTLASGLAKSLLFISAHVPVGQCYIQFASKSLKHWKKWVVVIFLGY